MRFDDTRTGWRIADDVGSMHYEGANVERKADENNRWLYELDTLKDNVGSLEHSLREALTEIAGVRSEIQMQEITIAELRAEINQLVAEGLVAEGE